MSIGKNSVSAMMAIAMGLPLVAVQFVPNETINWGFYWPGQPTRYGWPLTHRTVYLDWNDDRVAANSSSFGNLIFDVCLITGICLLLLVSLRHILNRGRLELRLADLFAITFAFVALLVGWSQFNSWMDFLHSVQPHPEPAVPTPIWLFSLCQASLFIVSFAVCSLVFRLSTNCFVLDEKNE